jgi:NAD(P)-dependent dehydrogenase (short-subunit alcohol dehydrogenase family)/acyl carrier protein
MFTGDLALLDEAGHVLAAITGLSVMAARRASLLQPREANLADWFYEVRWRQVALSSGSEPAPNIESWLILADAGGVGEALGKVLTAQGIASQVVSRDQLDMGGPEAITTLLADAASDAAPCRAVVCLWALDASPVDEATVVTGSNCSEALRLIQALARQGWREAPRLWLVTRRAQAVLPNEPRIAAEQALLWGLGRTMAQELPDLWGGLIDLDDDEPAAAALLARIIGSTVEDQLALRAGQCYAARLERAGLAQRDQPPRIDPEGIYLITGGLGAVGLALTQWLVANGARRLALVGRHAEASPATDELVRQGASVLVAACDVGQADELARLLERPELAGLRGIIHAAGVLDDGALVQLTPERLKAVLAPKVDGSWNLHRLTRGLALDFFVLCSSAAAIFGSAGQANYTAANAFLDALAHQRRASGLPALSVNWGPFAEAGMAAHTTTVRPRRNPIQSMEAIELEQAGPILGRLLSQSVPQLAVLPIRSGDLSRLAGQRSSLLASVARTPGPTQPQTAAVPPELARRLAAAHPAQRAQILLVSVIEQAAGVLDLDANQKLDPRRPLREYGLDSLMALDLSTVLSRLSGRKLPATFVYEQPTVEAMAACLGRELGIESSIPPQPAVDERAAAMAEVQQLSEKELNAFVAEALDSL